MVIGTVTLSRRAMLPVSRRVEREQTVFKGGGHTVRARNRGDAWLYLTWKIRGLPRSEYEALELYLKSIGGANFQAKDVTVVDDHGVSRTGRLTAAKFGGDENTGRLYDVEISFMFPESL